MKAKKPLAIALALAASAGWATDFVWTGASTAVDKTWADAANWTVNGAVTDTWPQTAEDTATFNTACVPVRNEEATVGEIILNADVTLRYDKWLNVGKISGSGELILMNRGRLRNISGTSLTCNNNIRITSSDSTDCGNGNGNHSAMPYIQANGANFHIAGKLLGDSHVFFTMAGGNYGVHLDGDNSEFTGAVHIDSNGSNRVKIGAAEAGFENGRLVIHGEVGDNGSMTFDHGTIHFGSIYTSSYATGAKFRSIDKYNTLVIGNLNRDDDRITIGMGDDANAYAKIVKVGTGTLELGPTRHRDGTIISNGVLKVTHPDGICHKNSDLTFDGGTLQYGLNPLDENAPVTKDVSSYVKNSTEFISVDTAGNDITWANESLYNNNIDAKGIQKIGEGTLELSGSKREGSWKFFTDASKTNYINGGVLAIRNGKKSDTPNLASKILGTGTLRIVSEEANGGYRLRGESNAFNEFDGTLEWANELDESEKAVGFMLNNAPLDISRAKVSITGNPESETIVMNGEVNSTRAVTVGAFDHLYPNAILKMKSPWKLNIIGTKGDSYLNGTIAGGVVTVTKTGAGKLTIGPDFSAPEGSAVNVNEGAFAMVAGMTQADLLSSVNIAEGVAFTGDGVFGAVNLSSHDVVPPADLTPETDHDTVFTLLTAESITGTSKAMADFLGPINAQDEKGEWKVQKVGNGDGTESLKCSWSRKAFMVIIR